MLRRSVTGLLLVALAQCAYAILELVGYSMDSSVHCAFVSVENSNESIVMPLPFAFTIVPQVVSAVGQKLLLLLTSLEFVVAQTPTHMMRLLDYNIDYPFPTSLPPPSQVVASTTF